MRPSQNTAQCFRNVQTTISRIRSKLNRLIPVSSRVRPNIKNSLIVKKHPKKSAIKQGNSCQDMIEPRDRVLEYNFYFEVELDEEQIVKSKTFSKSKTYQSLINKIKQFILEATSNTVSIAFNYFLDGKLQDKEAKEFASKNIILNVQSVFKETNKQIENNMFLKMIKDKKHIRTYMAADIDYLLNNILANLGDNYPEAPVSGGSLRMKQSLNGVNRTENEENDLIFACGKQICETLNSHDAQKGDYTEFMMKVINSLIESTQSTQEDHRQRTQKEIFTDFNQKLFWICQQKSYQPLINLIDNKKQVKQDSQQKIANIQTAKQFLKNYFDMILVKDAKQYKKAKAKIKQLKQKHSQFQINNSSPNLRRIPSIDDELSKNFKESLTSLLKYNQENIESMRKENKYSINQKVPGFVQPFSKQEILNKQFVAQHSSVLRIITKWTGYLEQIFQNCSQSIIQRQYLFKTTDNKLVDIKYKERQKLRDNLKYEHEYVKNKFQTLLRKNYEIIGDLMTEQPSDSSFVLRYSQTRNLSSKVSKVLTSLMVKYNSILIHHLLKAGSNIQTDIGVCNINLVVFRVSDILRSKLKCSETSFINILNTMYFLDNTDSMRQKFKLIRIKNKLDQSANNIIINYLFMGKIQCELQLSIQNTQGKEKKYHTFSHFLYELGRGKFGSLAECAIMISQIDPMIIASKGPYYSQKYLPKIINFDEEQISSNSQQIMKQIRVSTQKLEKQSQDLIFKCDKCHKHKINQKRTMFVQQEDKKECNGCILVNDPFPYEKLADIPYLRLKEFLNDKGKNLQRLTSYKSFDGFHDELILKLDSRGDLSLNLVHYVNKQLKRFMIKLDAELFEQIKLKNYDFSFNLNYFDLNQKIKQANHPSQRNVNCPQLFYLVIDSKIILEEMSSWVKLKHDELYDNIQNLIKVFRQFREEKCLIEGIKFKAEIIRANSRKETWQALDKSIRILNLKEKKPDESLKFRKFNNLNLFNIKILEAEWIKLDILPKWLKNCINLKELDLRHNNIQSLQDRDLPCNLKKLQLSHNHLTKIIITKMTDLEYLDLSVNNNQKEQIKIEELNNLRELNLSSNRLKEIHLNHLTRLQRIELKENMIQKVQIQGLLHLKTILLNENLLQQFIIQNTPQLHEINLNSNQKLTNVGLKDLAEIKKINLSNCGSKQNPIKFDVSDLNSLQDLNVSKSEINFLDCSNFKNLSSLRLDLKQLKRTDLTQNSSLTKLYLNSKDFQQFDMTQYKQQLQRLQIQSNGDIMVASIANLANYLKADYQPSKGHEKLTNLLDIRIVNGRAILETFKIERVRVHMHNQDH